MTLLDASSIFAARRRRLFGEWVNRTIRDAIAGVEAQLTGERVIEETTDLKGNTVQTVQTVQTKNGGEYLRLVPKTDLANSS